MRLEFSPAPEVAASREHVWPSLLDLNPPLHATMMATGNAPRTNMHVDPSVDLEELGPDRTSLAWESKAVVHASIASARACLSMGTALS